MRFLYFVRTGHTCALKLFSCNYFFHKVATLSHAIVSQQKTKLKRRNDNNKIAETATDAHIDKRLWARWYETFQLWFKSSKIFVIDHNLTGENMEQTLDVDEASRARWLLAFAHNIKWSSYTSKDYAFDCAHTLPYAYKNEIYFGVKATWLRTTALASWRHYGVSWPKLKLYSAGHL